MPLEPLLCAGVPRPSSRVCRGWVWLRETNREEDDRCCRFHLIVAGTSGTGSNRDQSGELHSLMNATSTINEQLLLAVRKLQDGGQCVDIN